MTYFAKKQTEVSQVANGIATEMLGAISTVNAFNMNLVAETKYKAKVDDVKDLGVRCAFSDRNLHSRMPLDPTHVRLKRTCV
jgi:hypothetical protein